MQMPPASTIPVILQKARWIWPQSPHWDLHNGYALFRKTVSIEALPRKALLHITADQSYQLYINGQYVCRGPGRGYQHNWPFDTLDVAKWLKPGKNLIAIRAYNPGHSTFQYISEGYAGLLLAARWGRTEILSGEGWKCRRQSGIRKDTVTTSLQLFSQEVIDLREEDPSWMHPKYDDSHWDTTYPSFAWNAMPWSSLCPRDIPMLEESVVSLGTVIGKSRGNAHPDWENTRNLAITRFEEDLGHQPDQAPSDSIDFSTTPKGQFSSRLIDLGKLQVGAIQIEVDDAKGGEVIECHCYETIDVDTLTPDYKPNAHSRMAFSHRLTCKQGKNQHSFYHVFGFRYLILTLRNNTTPITVRPSLLSSLYPMEARGQFASSDGSLNAIWQTCMWTQRVCSLDAYVDTPWREQAQWWGDARVQSWNTFHICGDDRLLRRGIRQISQQATPDGVTYGHAPTMAHGCVLPDFTLIWMLTLWDHYWQTGSTEAFETHRETVEKALEYFESWTDPKTGLLKYDSRFWLFLDWTELQKEGSSSVYSLWYLHALERMQQLYALTDNNAESAVLKKRANKLRKNLKKLIGSDGFMRDGYTDKGRINPHCSVHSQTLALITDLAPKHRSAMLTQSLLPEVTGQNTSKTRPSAYWITYVYEQLAIRGFGEEVLRDISSRWTPMVAHGTTWENFQPVKAEESFSHAWSAHPLFHCMQILGGIRQSAPAWIEVICSPTFFGTHADVSIPTPQGMIHSQWKRGGDFIEGKLSLPKGVSARLCLPKQKETMVTGTHSYRIPAN